MAVLHEASRHLLRATSAWSVCDEPTSWHLIARDGQSLVAHALSALISLAVTVRNLAMRTISGVRSATAQAARPAAPEAAALAATRREPEQPHNSDPVLVLDSVVKRYGALVAVNAVSFEVRRGEIFGILGPERRREDHHAGDD